MSKTYPRYLGSAQRKFGKAYPPCDSSGHVQSRMGDSFVTVSSGKINTYDVIESGFLRKKFNFESKGGLTLTKDSHIVSLNKVFKNGSGLCEISTPERSSNRFWIYKDVEEFAVEVQREIDNAPS